MDKKDIILFHLYCDKILEEAERKCNEQGYSVKAFVEAVEQIINEGLDVEEVLSNGARLFELETELETYDFDLRNLENIMEELERDKEALHERVQELEVELEQTQAKLEEREQSLRKLEQQKEEVAGGNAVVEQVGVPRPNAIETDEDAETEDELETLIVIDKEEMTDTVKALLKKNKALENQLKKMDKRLLNADIEKAEDAFIIETLTEQNTKLEEELAKIKG